MRSRESSQPCSSYTPLLHLPERSHRRMHRLYAFGNTFSNYRTKSRSFATVSRLAPGDFCCSPSGSMASADDSYRGHSTKDGALPGNHQRPICRLRSDVLAPAGAIHPLGVKSTEIKWVLDFAACPVPRLRSQPSRVHGQDSPRRSGSSPSSGTSATRSTSA